MKKTIVNEQQNLRLDKFLVEQLKEEFQFSRATIQKMILEDFVLVNGKVAKANLILKPNDVVEVEIKPVSNSEIVAENIPLAILYEDDDLLVVNKPNNMVVHPAPGNRDQTLVNALMYHVDQLSSVNDEARPGIVHRLDKQTTGVMIIAKNNLTHQKLTQMFSQHQVKKTYLALVQGVIEEDEGTIDAPIGRHEQVRQKMTVTSKNAKKAISHFKVLERFEKATLLEVEIETGRTHQIRVHFQYIDHPVLNDPIYGPSKENSTTFGQYLHAWKIEFQHPITKKQMHFESPLPIEFNDKIKELRNGV